MVAAPAQPPRSRSAAKEQNNLFSKGYDFTLRGNIYGEEKPMPSNHLRGVADGKELSASRNHLGGPTI
jgi:hypothetical protein